MMYIIGIGTYAGTCSEPWNVQMAESGLSLIIPDNLAFVTDVTRTVEIYTLSGYLCRDGLESFGFNWSLVLAFGKSFPSCLCPFA